VAATPDDFGEVWVTFRVVFDGDCDGAIASAKAWTDRVGTFGGIDRITLRRYGGTDRTNVHVFDEETTAAVESLAEETKAQIDQLMNPDCVATFRLLSGNARPVPP
jgi:hypothetical protein